MIRSMTGFGAADGEVGGGRVSVEVRSVNHRFFSPSIKLPGVLQRWEGEVRDAMRRSVTRGHVTLSARFERDEADTGMLPIDERRFAAYVDQLRGLQQRNCSGRQHRRRDHPAPARCLRDRRAARSSPTRLRRSSSPSSSGR